MSESKAGATFEDGQPPRTMINLNGLQARYPDPEDADIIGRCQSIVIDALMFGEGFQEIKTALYGEPTDFAQKTIVDNIGSNRLATVLFIDTLIHGIAEATDMDQFSWRLGAFLTDDVRNRDYIEKTSDPTREKASNLLSKQQLTDPKRLQLSIAPVIAFCQANPKLEEAAIQQWITSKLFAVHDLPGQSRRSPLQEDVIRRVQAQLLKDQEPEQQERTVRLVERLRVAAQWRRQALAPAEVKVPRWVSDIELIPIDQIPLIEIEAFRDHVMSEEFEPKTPANLITSALKAIENFLATLVRSELERGGFTGVLYSKLEGYDGDNPLGYADFIGLANRLTPILQKQGLEVDDLDTHLLEDFPKAIDRVLFIVLTDKKAQLERTDQLTRFELAAGCIRRLAFKGVEGKLEQRVLTLGEIAMRYPDLPGDQLGRLVREYAQGDGQLYEIDIARSARRLIARRRSSAT